MSIGLLGRKLGMTHVYDEFGRRRAVTAIQAGPCTVVEVRSAERNRYDALQLGFEPVAEKRLSRPRAGQFKRAGVGPFRVLREFRLRAPGEWSVGQELTVDVFQDYELVDVTATSIGKGFQGGMKRWNWSGGPKTHGSMSHRAPGSSGSGTTPGRVLRGHHFPGHQGAVRVTVPNLRVIRRDPEHHLLLVEGSVPGAERGLVLVRKSAKRPNVIKRPQLAQEVLEEEAAAAKSGSSKGKKR